MFVWKLLADWNQDGLFGHAQSDLSAVWIRANWRLGMREPYQSLADEAEATIDLINTDGRFNPDNTSSPLYGKLVPGVRIWIRGVDEDAETATTMYKGRLERVVPYWEPGSGALSGQALAALICSGWKQMLQETKVNIPLYEDWHSSKALIHMLDDLGIDTAKVDGGVTILPYYGGDEAKEAWQVVRELTEAERGRFWEDRDGDVVWWQRHKMMRTTTPAGTISYTAGAYKPYHLDYAYAKWLSNSVRVQAYQRELEGSSEVLWELKEPLDVPPGEQRVLYAVLEQPSSNKRVAISSVTLQNVTFSSGTATVTTATKGGEVEVTISNASVWMATLASMELAAQPVVRRYQVVAEVQDAASIEAYGMRGARTLDLRALSTFETARQIALYELYRRGQPYGAAEHVTFRRRADGADNAHLLAWEIGTRIAIDVPANGPQQEYFIIGEEHWIGPGRLHETRYDLEPADRQSYWILDDSRLSDLGETTRLGY